MNIFVLFLCLAGILVGTLNFYLSLAINYLMGPTGSVLEIVLKLAGCHLRRNVNFH